jgi:hypothetical protein
MASDFLEDLIEALVCLEKFVCFNTVSGRVAQIFLKVNVKATFSVTLFVV